MTDITGLLRDKDDDSTLIPEVELSEIEAYKAEASSPGHAGPRSTAWPTPSAAA